MTELVDSSGEAPQALRVLYVAGLARSGSTVLGYVLGELPGAIFVGELHFSGGGSLRASCAAVVSRFPTAISGRRSSATLSVR